MKYFFLELNKIFQKATQLVVVVSFLSLSMYACSKDDDMEKGKTSSAPTAKEVIKDMSAGFNLGNTFDYGLNSTDVNSNKSIIDLYYKAGMKHVRIPVTWMDRFSDNIADENGNVNTQHSRLKELKEIIDYAIGLDMFVVINTHHEHWLKDNYDGSAAMDAKFKNLWTGIANYFKDYDYHLIFEVLNEPEGKLGEGWASSEGFPEPTSAIALTYTRNVNEVGYTAIRATGGNNETRIIMVSVNGQGNENMLPDVYPTKATLPDSGNDSFLAIQVHSYNPWAFCGNTGSNSAYPGNASVQGAIQTVSNHAKILNVPINYGEFGVGRESNVTERNTDLVRGYYKTFAQKALLENMSYTVWDDRGWFKLIEKDGSSGYKFVYDIVPSMLE